MSKKYYGNLILSAPVHIEIRYRNKADRIIFTMSTCQRNLDTHSERHFYKPANNGMRRDRQKNAKPW